MSTLDLRREPDGRRYVRPYLGTNKVTGRPLRPYLSFPDDITDEECMAKAEAWLAEIAPYSDEGVTARLGECLERYIRWCETSGYAANTVRCYRSCVKRIGALCNAPVRDVTTQDIEALYEHLLLRGGEDGEGLARSTVITLHQFLRGAWNHLVAIGAAGINPVAFARPPRPESFEARALDEDEYEKLAAVIAQAIEGDATPVRRCVAFAAELSLNTGLRCGEVCALQRRDVTLATNTIHVGATVTEGNGRPERKCGTKNRKARNVALPPGMADVVREHWAWQDGRIGRVSKRTPLVSPDGSLMRPSKVTREFSAMAREAGLPEDVTFHTLRHTHATWLIAQGIDAKTVSERLGHADVATTLRIYSHVMPGRDRQAAEAFLRAKGGVP